MGSALHAQGQWADALASYQQALWLDPNDAHAYYNRGGAYYRQRQFDKAINDYNEVIRLGRSAGEDNLARRRAQ